MASGWSRRSLPCGSPKAGESRATAIVAPEALSRKKTGASRKGRAEFSTNRPKSSAVCRQKARPVAGMACARISRREACVTSPIMPKASAAAISVGHQKGEAGSVSTPARLWSQFQAAVSGS